MTVTDLKYLLSKMDGASKVLVNDGYLGVIELREEMIVRDHEIKYINGKRCQVGDELIIINPTF